jgi:hypothetical protein
MMSIKKLASRTIFRSGRWRSYLMAGSVICGLRLGRGRAKGPGVSRPPGSRIYRFINAVFPRQKVESIFSPIIANWQTEYCAELFAGRYRQAKLLRVTYTWMLIKAAGLGRLFNLLLSALERVKAI